MIALTEKQKDDLFEAWAYCDWKDKSTPFMIQYMANAAGVDHDTVIEFIDQESENRQKWYAQNEGWFKKYEVKT